MQINSRSRFGRRTRLLALAAVGASFALPVTAQAADVAYIKFPGADLAGDVTVDKELRGASQLLHYQWFLGRRSPDQKAVFNGFHFTKSIDRASPGLMLAAADGRVIPSVRVLVRKPGVTPPARATYLEYCLEHVVVVDDAHNMRADGEPVEGVTLSAGRLSQRYIPSGSLAPATPVTASWSLQTNSLGAFPGICGE